MKFELIINFFIKFYHQNVIYRIIEYSIIKRVITNTKRIIQSKNKHALLFCRCPFNTYFEVNVALQYSHIT